MKKKRLPKYRQTDWQYPKGKGLKALFQLIQKIKRERKNSRVDTATNASGITTTVEGPPLTQSIAMAVLPEKYINAIHPMEDIMDECNRR